MSYETDRNRLARKAAEILGDDEGGTLMDHLPHGGWSNFATKDDLKTQGILLRADILAMTETLRKEIAEASRRQLFAIVGLMAAMMSAQTALIVAFVR